MPDGINLGQGPHPFLFTSYSHRLAQYLAGSMRSVFAKRTNKYSKAWAVCSTALRGCWSQHRGMKAHFHFKVGRGNPLCLYPVGPASKNTSGSESKQSRRGKRQGHSRGAQGSGRGAGLRTPGHRRKGCDRLRSASPRPARRG